MHRDVYHMFHSWCWKNTMSRITTMTKSKIAKTTTAT